MFEEFEDISARGIRINFGTCFVVSHNCEREWKRMEKLPFHEPCEPFLRRFCSNTCLDVNIVNIFNDFGILEIVNEPMDQRIWVILVYSKFYSFRSKTLSLFIALRLFHAM